MSNEQLAMGNEQELFKLIAQGSGLMANKGCGQMDLLLNKNSFKSIAIKDNKFDFISSGESSGAGVRAIVNGKIGFAFTNDLKRLRETAENAVRLAKHSQEKLCLRRFSGYKKPRNIFDKRIVRADEKEFLECLKQAIDAAERAGADISSAGLSISSDETKYLSSERLELSEQGTSQSFCVDINYKGCPGWQGRVSAKYFDDFADATAKAIDIAKKNSVKGDIKTGRYEVLFAPLALEELFPYTLLPNFDGDFVAKGKSKLKGKLGKKIFSDNLTIVDDGLLDSGLCSGSFDGDGVPCQRTALVEKGVLRNFLYDLGTAQREDVKPTGNGARSFASMTRISPSNVVVKPTDLRLKTQEQVIREMDKGLLLFSPLNAHSANSTSGDFSLGASIAFWIEKGEIKFAPKQVMVSGNIFELLKDVKLIGNDARQMGNLVSGSLVAECQVIG